jgi:hypothetical protein
MLFQGAVWEASMTFLGTENPQSAESEVDLYCLLIIHRQIFGEEDNHVLEFDVTFCIHAVFCHG